MANQYMNQQGQGQGQAPRLGLMNPSYNQGVQGVLQGAQGAQSSQGAGLSANQAMPGVLTSPVDVPTLIATKGYNPAEFDLRPQNVSHRKLSSHYSFLTLFILEYCISRLASSLSSLILRMTSTSRLSMRFGVLRIPVIRGLIRRLRRIPARDLSIFSSVSMLADTSAVWRRC